MFAMEMLVVIINSLKMAHRDDENTGKNHHSLCDCLVSGSNGGFVSRYCRPMLPGHWPSCEDYSDQSTALIQGQSSQEGTKVCHLLDVMYLFVVFTLSETFTQFQLVFVSLLSMRIKRGELN